MRLRETLNFSSVIRMCVINKNEKKGKKFLREVFFLVIYLGDGKVFFRFLDIALFPTREIKYGRFI